MVETGKNGPSVAVEPTRENEKEKTTEKTCSNIIEWEEQRRHALRDVADEVGKGVGDFCVDMHSKKMLRKVAEAGNIKELAALLEVKNFYYGLTCVIGEKTKEYINKLLENMHEEDLEMIKKNIDISAKKTYYYLSRHRIM